MGCALEMNELDFFLLGIFMGAGVIYSFFNHEITLGILVRIGRMIGNKMEYSFKVDADDSEKGGCLNTEGYTEDNGN